MIRNLILAAIAALAVGAAGGGWLGYWQASKSCKAEKAAAELSVVKESLNAVEKITSADRPVTAQAAEKRSTINDYFAGIKRPPPKKNGLTESPASDASAVPDPTPPTIEEKPHADQNNALADDWRLPDADWLLFYDCKQGLRLARP
ncbi:MAG: hypothetical protein LBE75_06135 [Burkholderiales bacterium]|jgi:hypothetical protein|nr:hypothetical protein [Burkholderiales bacterium]